jgi:hypothetical protein
MKGGTQNDNSNHESVVRRRPRDAVHGSSSESGEGGRGPKTHEITIGEGPISTEKGLFFTSSERPLHTRAPTPLSIALKKVAGPLLFLYRRAYTNIYIFSYGLPPLSF